MSKSGGHYTLASPTPNSGGRVPPSPKVYASVLAAETTKLMISLSGGTRPEAAPRVGFQASGMFYPAGDAFFHLSALPGDTSQCRDRLEKCVGG